jgi:hypothetical protein
LLSTLSILLLPICCVISCGKKRPPIPPRQIEPPPVTDLKRQIEGDQLTLTWTIPKGKRQVISSLAGFNVYRSKKAVSTPVCEDCPVFFTRMAVMPIRSEMLEKGMMTYSETLEKGFRYVYKVTVHTKAGIISGDSNYIEFTY